MAVKIVSSGSGKLKIIFHARFLSQPCKISPSFAKNLQSSFFLTNLPPFFLSRLKNAEGRRENWTDSTKYVLKDAFRLHDLAPWENNLVMNVVPWNPGDYSFAWRFVAKERWGKTREYVGSLSHDHRLIVVNAHRHRHPRNCQ